MKRLWILVVIFLLWAPASPTQAQEPRFFTYDETVGGVFITDDPAPHIWVLPVADFEWFSVIVRRVGGRFTPTIEVLGPTGQTIEPAVPPTISPDGGEVLIFPPSGGNYTIIVGGPVSDTGAFTPNEYTLTATRLGTVIPEPDANLSPLPVLGTEPPPPLQTGAPTADAGLNVTVYDGFTEQPDARTRPNDFVARGSNGRAFAINNANPIERGVGGIGFVGVGVGFFTNAEAPAVFYSEQDITAFEVTSGIYTIQLATGRQIITDFYRIESIHAADNLVAVRTTNGQRLIFDSPILDMRRRGGINGEGPNAEPINEFKINGDNHIFTDLSGWKTLGTFNDGGVLRTRVIYDNNMRLISDVNRVVLLQTGNQTNPELDPPGLFTDQRIIRVEKNPDGEQAAFIIQPYGMGDVVINSSGVSVQPLDGRILNEPLANLNVVRIENRAVQFDRSDGTHRFSLPDRTDIETPAAIPQDEAALTGQVGHIPRHFNNLGETHTDYRPHIPFDHALRPVNRVNGNFYYPVTEFDLPSSKLSLTWTRTYNSMAPTTQTPLYMLTAGQPYMYGQLGDRWRHSYQYELDITYAPLGQVEIILPDGSRHRFANSADSIHQFRSNTLRSWRLERQFNLTAHWIARTGSGTVYDFDQAGRLERITDGQGNTLVFSRAPRHRVAEAAAQVAGVSGGFFVTETYGRRIEAYTNEAGRLVLMRDAEGRDITYTYADTTLSTVQYVDLEQRAAYTYEQGRLAVIDDTYSPYHQTSRVQYDALGRVIAFTENPNEANPDAIRVTRFDYNTPNQVIESTVVNGEPRISTWEHNALFQLTHHYTPVEGWFWRYDYDPNGTLSGIRQPNGAIIGLVFDPATGNLLRLLDPDRTQTYTFAYDVIGGYRQQLREITYPGVGNIQGKETFLYNDRGQVIERSRPIQGGQEPRTRILRYTYDEQYRLASSSVIATDGTEAALTTSYTYDEYGYLARISEGEDLRVQQFDHDNVGRLVAYTDGRGNVTTLEWNFPRNRVVAITSPDMGIETRYTYDVRNRITSVTDRAATTSYTYNDLNQITSVTDPLGEVNLYDYDLAGNIRRMQLPLDGDQSYTYTYDGLNRLTRMVSPNGLIEDYAYTLNETGNQTITTVTDFISDRTSYVYNTIGRLVQVNKIDPNNREIFRYSLDYDGLGNLVSVGENHVPNGRTLQISYDAVGKPLRSAIANTETRLEYDAFERLLRVSDASGRAWTYERDPLGNVIAVILPDGTRQSYTYDENRNLTAFTNGLDETTTYTYDPLNRLTGELLPDGARIGYEYDARSNLVTIIPPLADSTLSAVYDDANRLVRLGLAAENAATSYTYDPIGRLTAITAPGGASNSASRSFTYDREGNVVAINVAEDQDIFYGYDGLGRVTSITNTLGYSTSYAYNRAGRLNQMTDPVGNTETFVWGSGGRLNQYETTNSARYVFNYDDLGRAISIFDRSLAANAIEMRFTYDPAGYLLGIQQITGSNQAPIATTLHQYTYTPNGQVETYTAPGTETPWRFSYDPAGRMVQAVDPGGTVTMYTRNTRGWVTEITHAPGTPDETREGFEYDANGNVTRHIAPDGYETTFQYNARNQLTSRIDGANTSSPRQSLFTYDERGNLIDWTDPNGEQIRYRYTLNRLVQIQRALRFADGNDPVPITTTYDYDPLGNLTGITLPGGESIVMTYNSLNQRVRYVDPIGDSWAYSYDPAGNLRQQSDPLGSLTEFEYDSANRITRITYPTGAQIDVSYAEGDANARRIITPPNGRDEINSRERILYVLDASDNLVRIEHGTQDITTFEHDDRGNIIKRRDATGRETNYTYDAHNRLIQVSSPDGAIIIGYDAAGRVTNISDSRGNTATYTYDEHGHLQTMTNGELSISYAHDAVGNLLLRDAGPFGRVEYEYDNLYRPIRITKDGSGITLTYNADSQITRIERDNGVSTSYRYDANGRVTEILHLGADGQLLDLFGYIYDAVGNITKIERLDQWKVIYSYDRSHQLIGERWLNPENQIVYSVGIEYDAVGNRVSETVRRNFEQPVRTRYIYNAQNQLTEEIRNFVPPDEEAIFGFDVLAGLLTIALLMLLARRFKTARTLLVGLMLFVAPLTVLGMQPLGEKITYEYDANGNLVSITAPGPNVLTLGYDAHNRLTRISGTSIDGLLIDVTYTYDLFSQLATVSTPTRQFRLFYDNNALIGLRDLTDNRQMTYFSPLEGSPPLRQDHTDGTAIWPLSDVLNTPRKLVNGDGSLVTEQAGFNFDAFGSIITPYGPTEAYQFNASGALVSGANADPGSPFPTYPAPMFAGQLHDPASGLYIMGVRAYNPFQGRFIQRDPARHDPQGNLYTYAYNQPQRFIDPQGLTPQEAIGALQAPNLADDLLPDSRPEPALPNIPTPQNVHHLQAQELHRPLAVAAQLGATINNMQGMLDPGLCDFYMASLRSPSEAERMVMTAPMQAIVGTFSDTSGWVPQTTPNPNDQPAAFVQLMQAQPTLSQVAANGRLWADFGCEHGYGLPQVPILTPNDGQLASQRQLTELLQHIPLESVVAVERHALTSMQFQDIAPAPASAHTPLAPTVTIRRPSLFGDLHGQTYDFAQETILLTPPLHSPSQRIGRTDPAPPNLLPPTHLQMR